jgi:hypothetical protein
MLPSTDKYRVGIMLFSIERVLSGHGPRATIYSRERFLDQITFQQVDFYCVYLTIGFSMDAKSGTDCIL